MLNSEQLINFGLVGSGHDTERKILEDFIILILYFSNSIFAFSKFWILFPKFDPKAKYDTLT